MACATCQRMGNGAAIVTIRRTAQLRMLARVLAVGGGFWSVFCLPLLLGGVATRTIPTLGPGYLITAGYVIRAVMPNPPSAEGARWARRIWCLSAVVQGVWLGWWWSGAIENPRDHTLMSPFGISIMLWWTFATIASLYGVFAEPRPTDASEGPAS